MIHICTCIGLLACAIFQNVLVELLSKRLVLSTFASILQLLNIYKLGSLDRGEIARSSFERHFGSIGSREGHGFVIRPSIAIRLLCAETRSHRRLSLVKFEHIVAESHLVLQWRIEALILTVTEGALFIVLALRLDDLIRIELLIIILIQIFHALL